MRKYIITGAIFAVVAFLCGAFIIKNAQIVNYDNYDLNTILPGDEANGNIADHVKGNPDAPVLLFEYADYQCPGCATLNPRLNTLLDEYGDKLGVVYRSYLLSYHQNGTAAASAAEAAAMQGYWKEYADLLFSNQNSWGYASGDERTEYFEKYFTQVAGDKGDMEKFRKDMASSEVSKKIKFDIGAGNVVGIDSTPTLMLNGEKINVAGHSTTDDFLNFMRETIDAELEKKEK